VVHSPAYADGHAYLGHVSSLLGEQDRAERYLTQAIALAPDHPLPRYFLGMHYLRRGWTFTGRDVLLQAYELDPENPAICAAVADTYLREDPPFYGAAERWLMAAVSNAPEDVRFQLLLAHLYVDYNIDPGVRGVITALQAIRLAPESSEALETLGWAYHLGGRPSAALDPLLRARDLSPETARIHYRLGEVYRALDRVELARASYRQAIDLDWQGIVGARARDALSQL
jgi:Flp pilus assembly protein TadD